MNCNDDLEAPARIMHRKGLGTLHIRIYRSGPTRKLVMEFGLDGHISGKEGVASALRRLAYAVEEEGA